MTKQIMPNKKSKGEDIMENLLEVDVSFKGLYRILIEPIKSKLLLTGIELKIFNHLTEPNTANDVAEAIGAHQENTRLFLDGLAASDLVVKKNGLFQNTTITQAFLVEDSPTFMGRMLTVWAQFFTLNDLSKWIKEGPPSPSSEMDMSSEGMYAQMAATMANYQRACTQQITAIISELPEFLSFKKMLDLGGGPGLIGMAIVDSHPSMKGTIFDLPLVVKVAGTFIREYKMEDRMDVLGGDFTRDSIGEKYDLIWASVCLYYGKDNIDSLAKKIYNALNPGGVFVSYHEGLTHEHTRPDIMALSWLPTALIGQNMVFDQDFLVNSMLRVGFKTIRSKTLETPVGPMDLEIGRK